MIKAEHLRTLSKSVGAILSYWLICIFLPLYIQGIRSYEDISLSTLSVAMGIYLLFGLPFLFIIPYRFVRPNDQSLFIILGLIFPMLIILLQVFFPHVHSL